MSKASEKRAEQERARTELRRVFPQGSSVSVFVASVSSSGMSRQMLVIGVDPSWPGGLLNMSWAVAKAVGWTYNSRGATVRVGGVGMDMRHHLVSTLAHELYGDGYALTVNGLN